MPKHRWGNGWPRPKRGSDTSSDEGRGTITHEAERTGAGGPQAIPGHSGRPASRRPLAHVDKSSAMRNGPKSLRLEACRLGSHSSALVMALCAGSSRPASALLAAEMHIASRKVGLSRIAFSAHDDAMS